MRKYDLVSMRTTCLLLLFLSSFAHASDLADVISSSVQSANQRPARSAGLRLSVNQDAVKREEEQEDEGCCVRSDRPLIESDSSRVGVGLPGSVIDLYSWPRSVWPAPAGSPLPSPSLDQDQSLRHSDKRGTHKFNPSGWRRKRSTRREEDEELEDEEEREEREELERSGESIRRLLDDVVANYLEMSRSDVFRNGLANEEPGPDNWEEERGLKRSGLSRRGPRSRRPQRLPKRKPLEFNPTGW